MGFHPFAPILRQQLEIRELEEHLNDNLKCEMKHRGPSRCSIEVTHRLTFCEGAVNICASAAKAKAREKSTKNHRCLRCQQPAEECWVIRVI